MTTRENLGKRGTSYRPSGEPWSLLRLSIHTIYAVACDHHVVLSVPHADLHTKGKNKTKRNKSEERGADCEQTARGSRALPSTGRSETLQVQQPAILLRSPKVRVSTSYECWVAYRKFRQKRNIALSMYRIKRVLPFVPWHPRIFLHRY